MKVVTYILLCLFVIGCQKPPAPSSDIVLPVVLPGECLTNDDCSIPTSFCEGGRCVCEWWFARECVETIMATDHPRGLDFGWTGGIEDIFLTDVQNLLPYCVSGPIEYSLAGCVARFDIDTDNDIDMEDYAFWQIRFNRNRFER